MKKKIINNFRIIVVPEEPWFILEKTNEERVNTWVRTCKELINQINRHVDDVHDVYHQCDVSYICSYCGLTWEEDESGLPQCCERAQEKWEITQEVLDEIC